MEDLSDPEVAIQLFSQPLDTMPENHPNRPILLQNLAIAYRNRYESKGELTDLEISIQRCQEALQAMPEGHPGQPQQLESLGLRYVDKYKRTGEISDLDIAIQQFQRSVNTLSNDDLGQVQQLQSLGHAYNLRHLHTKAISDLDAAIRQFQNAIDIMRHDHEDREPCLKYLGKLSIERQKRTQAMPDPDATTQQSLETLGANSDLEQAQRLENFGNSLYHHHKITGKRSDLEAAIHQYHEALVKTGEDDPRRSQLLTGLWAGYGTRYEISKDLPDIDASIQRSQEALDMTPKDHSDRIQRICMVGAGYHHRHLRRGDISDLKIAIQKYHEALDGTPEDHPKRAQRLEDLGSVYLLLSDTTGRTSDVQAALQWYQESLRATPDNDPDRARRLSSLAIGYKASYARIGATSDLDIALSLCQEAINIIPEDQRERARHQLGLLGDMYNKRGSRLGAMADIEAAIKYCHQAIDATPKDDPDQAHHLYNIGSAYYSRFHRTRDISDLDAAFEQYQKALDVTPEDHPVRSLYLHSLASVFRIIFLIRREISYLETYIKLSQEALGAASEDHPAQAQQLEAIGVGYHDRFKATREVQDLHVAIQNFHEALKKTPNNHPDRAIRLECLAIGYRDRSRVTGERSDQEAAAKCFQEAFDNYSSPISDRLRSGRALLIVYKDFEDWQSAYQVASRALQLLPLLTPNSLRNADKQSLLAGFAGMGSIAANVAVMAGKPVYEAIRLLELGRGLIVGSLSDMRSDISRLQQEHPRLAEELIHLRGQLDIPSSSDQTSQSDKLLATIHQGDLRYEASKKMDKALQAIRSLPGFNQFLLSSSEDEIKDAAAHGPIVVINAVVHCHVFIIQKDRLGVLPLPDLSYDEICEHAATPNDPEVLEWLWEAIVKRILDTLGFTETPVDGHWPRVCWIPIGVMSKFPIHAAGYHFHDSSETVIDRVISSYSFSIKTIVQSRQSQNGANEARRPERLVVVGMQGLQYTRQEVDMLEGICNSMQLQIIKARPYQKDVLAAISDCDIFHFAGHGRTYQLDPSESALILDDGPLTVASLFETNLYNRKPFLAYLSACATARIEEFRLVDEGINLIAACQLAGFQHVIGTLWEVNDELCVDVATMTYEWMRQYGINDKSVGEGLHQATRVLRDRWVSEDRTGEAQEPSPPSPKKERDSRDAVPEDEIPPTWVPFVYFGT